MKILNSSLSHRSFSQKSIANSWEEIWEAGPYYDRVAELLEDAKEYAIVVGWQIDSRLPLKKPSRFSGDPCLAQPPETLREKVIRLCDEKPGFQVYFLIWDHAYFYVFEREVWQGRIWENVHPRVHFVFDNRHPLGGSHHEKICSIDGRTVLVGGIDLCDDRWDGPQHLYSDPRRSLNWREEKHGPYHDLAVQLTGPICKNIQEHVAKRWESLSSLPFPKSISNSFCRNSATIGPVDRPVGHQVYLSRTLVDVAQTRPEAAITREVEFLFRDLIQAAENRIILEGQYYWSEILNDMLIAKILEKRGSNFEVILILADLQLTKSLTRHMAGYELKLLRKLDLAAQFAGVRLIMGCPYVFSSQAPALPPKPIYIHSKVLVIDDRYLGIGTANFATRALRIDTEIHLTLEANTPAERSHVQRVANSILDHWKVFPPHRHSDIWLRAIKPSVELTHFQQERGWGGAFPWQKFFDPLVPWFYPVRYGYQRLAHKYHLSAGLGLTFLWILGAGLTCMLSGVLSKNQAFWPIFYCLFLSSVWLIPIPFFGTILLMAFHLGISTADRVGVVALWISSILGYCVIRTFPSRFAQLYQFSGPKSLHKLFGLRTFPVVLSVLTNPRVSIHSKIVFQGLYCIPLPWFALGTLVILPAILSTASRWLVALIVYML